jgi:hypothetical protein
MPYYCIAISQVTVTDFPALFRLIEAQKKWVKLGELHKWSLADVLSDVDAMPSSFLPPRSRSIISAAVRENAIDGKILCGFEVSCIYDVNALL